MALVDNQYTAGFFSFTQNGDYAVPVTSALAPNIRHLEDAPRVGKKYEAVHFTRYVDNELRVYAGSAEVLIGFLYVAPWFSAIDPGTKDWIAGAIRMGIVSLTAQKYMENYGEIEQLMKAHSDMYGAHDEIIQALLDTPRIALKDSEYVKREQKAIQQGPWSGMYGVTENAKATTVTTLNKGKKVLLLRTEAAEVASEGTGSGIDIELTDGRRGQLKVYQVSSKEVYVRGVVQDLVPKKLKEFSYSLNFSGWTDARWKVHWNLVVLLLIISYALSNLWKRKEQYAI